MAEEDLDALLGMEKELEGMFSFLQKQASAEIESKENSKVARKVRFTSSEEGEAVGGEAKKKEGEQDTDSDSDDDWIPPPPPPVDAAAGELGVYTWFNSPNVVCRFFFFAY